MTSGPQPQKHVRADVSVDNRSGQEVLKGLRTNEVFVAIVGPAGSGSGTAAKILKTFFDDNDFEVEIVKASALIRAAAERAKLCVPPSGERKSIGSVRMMQDRGDELRKGELYSRPEDHSAIARLVLKEIAERRAKLQGQIFSGIPVEPNGKHRAYIIDTLRHPAEVAMLREVYQDAFTLLGIVCDPVIREKRIRENFFDRSKRGDAEVKEQVRNFGSVPARSVTSVGSAG